MSFAETFKKGLHSLFYYPDDIVREVTVNGKAIEACYRFSDKTLRFYNKEGKPYELNGAGAFAVVNAVLDAFEGENIKEIQYDLHKSDEHVETRNKLYARALRAHGYKEKGLYQKKSVFNRHGIWIKRREQGSGRLEKALRTTSITSILASIIFLTPNLTGNVISNLTITSSNLVGACLFCAGLVAGLLWNYFSK